MGKDQDTIGGQLLDEVQKLAESVEEKVDSMDERVSVIEKSQTDYRNDISNLASQVKTWTETGVPVDQKTVEKAIEEILDKQFAEQYKQRAALPSGQTKTVIPDVWKSGANIADLVENASAMDVGVSELLSKGYKGFDRMMSLPPMDENHKHILRMGTEVKLANEFARHSFAASGSEYRGLRDAYPKLAKVWGKTVLDFVRSYGIESKAHDLTTLANWVPTGWSSELREIIQLELTVASLFERIPMPYSPFELPIDLTDELGAFLAETSGVVNPWDDTTLNTLDDQKTTFTAKKLRARFLTTGEVLEDSIVPLLPLMRRKLVNILAQSLETAIINGATGTHIDTDTAAGAATLPQKMWDGIRKFCNANSFETSHAGAAPTVVGLNGIRASMGEYGVNQNELAYLVPISVYINILEDDDIHTVDKFGQFATILSGELAKVYGIPVIVSRHSRMDLDATGVNGASGNTLTALQLVNRRAWMIGDRRRITLESERLINTDQTNIVAFQRMDFQNVFNFGTPKKKVAWQLYNIAN